MQPSVGRIVHYVSYGTPAGEYGKECRAAVVTEVTDAHTVGLCVLNPTGLFLNQGVQYHAGGEQAGTPECPQAESHGNPFRYCACGWIEAAFQGGTWHWPEQVPRDPGDRPPRY